MAPPLIPVLFPTTPGGPAKKNCFKYTSTRWLFKITTRGYETEITVVAMEVSQKYYVNSIAHTNRST